MKAFKSFVIKIDVGFDPKMKVIIGSNGSGKSKIRDALCFVLGRLSIKSIRAAKAALIFSGEYKYKDLQEASVELVFDNEESLFQ